MPFIDHSGANLHWRSDGAENLPALLLGNSMGADTGMWDLVVPSFTPHFRVIRFDNRGHGKSTLHDESKGAEFSMELLARDALAVADAAGAARFRYVGLSIGGMVGIWLGKHAASRIDRLVLSNTSAIMPAGIWADRIAAVRKGGLATQVDGTMERWFTSSWRESPENRQIVDKARAAFLATQVDGYCGCGSAIRDMDFRDVVQDIAVPTLVVAGEFDTSTPSAAGREIRERISGSSFVELPTAHMPAIQSPAEYASLVLDFLK